jgi:hypothetical protein
MARARPLPDALEMRVLKYGARPEAERDRVAEALLEQDRLAEAILLFDGRPGHPLLAEAKARAVRLGAGFLLTSLLQRMGAAVEPEDLRACARAAEANGRWLEARQCHQALGDAEGLGRVDPHLPPALRQPPTP